MVSLRPRVLMMVACLLLVPAFGLETAGTSRWSEGAPDFPNGSAQNTVTGGGDVRLGRDLAHPGNWTCTDGGTSVPFSWFGYSMVYDEQDDVLVLYADGLWVFDAAGGQWKKCSASGPAGRREAALAYDSANHLVMLFGGWTFRSAGGPQYHDDTWLYDVALDTWTERNPAVKPPPRAEHSLTYDPYSGEVVLFGGMEPGWYMNDTWTYNVSADAWTQRSPAVSPPARCLHAATLDSWNGQVILFGGSSGQAQPSGLSDTWTYDVATDTWTERTIPGAPPARYQAGLAFDQAQGAAVLFGGKGNIGKLDDTWMLSLMGWQWTDRSPRDPPPAQNGHVLVFHETLGASVLFTGQNEHGNLSETWTYDAGANKWTCLTPPVRPSPRENHALAYDVASERVLLFGGTFAWGRTDDAWVYDPRTDAWTPLARSGPWPSPREGPALVHDARTGSMVLFGGSGPSGSKDDTWTLNLSTSTWTRMDPPSAPPGRHDHGMVYDSVAGRVLLFGGMRIRYSPSYEVENLGDTWTYDVSSNRWTQKAVQWAPSARCKHSMAYDPNKGVAVLFGGSEIGGLLGDTWTFGSVSGTWTNVTRPPSPRKGYDHALVYGGPCADILLFGGWDGNVAVGGGVSVCNPFPNETWSFNSSTLTWTNRTRPGSPAPRFQCEMAFAAHANAVVMFGGYSFQSLLGDTWEFGSWALFSDGTYTSRPFDTGGRAYFGDLNWKADVPAGTALRFQVRAGATEGSLSSRAFTGPDGTAGTFHSSPGQSISQAQNGSRWVQYRAYLASGDPSATPALQNVTIGYNLLQEVGLLSPGGGENWTGKHVVNWTALDPDGNGLSFDIELLGEAGNVPLASGLPDAAREWEWDTSAVPNGTYRLAVIATDDDAEIPLSATATSAEFVVFHPPPPNRPPRVTLLAPENGSVLSGPSVTFRWLGEDDDGDRLTYNLTCWTNESGRWQRMWTVTNLTFTTAMADIENVTYHWNVSAFDGQDRSPPSPTWSFRIDRSVGNHPPVILSTAPANATAGMQYQYLFTAEDEDDDTLTFTLLDHPEGMRQGGVLPGNTGMRVLWTPTRAQAGLHNATVEVTDGRGGRAVQTFSVLVGIERPTCTISYPPNGTVVNGTLRMSGTSARGSGEVHYVEVRIDGGKWMAANGTYIWTIDIHTTTLGNGVHWMEARSSDAELFSDPVGVQVTVLNKVPRPKPPATTLEGGPLAFLAVLMLVAVLAAVVMLGLRKRGSGS